jgi:hypothetical protein
MSIERKEIKEIKETKETKYIEELIDDDAYAKELNRRRILSLKIPSITGKRRTFDETFGQEEYDSERYGQQITADYFKNKVGHTVIYN